MVTSLATESYNNIALALGLLLVTGWVGCMALVLRNARRRQEAATSRPTDGAADS